MDYRKTHASTFLYSFHNKKNSTLAIMECCKLCNLSSVIFAHSLFCDGELVQFENRNRCRNGSLEIILVFLFT